MKRTKRTLAILAFTTVVGCSSQLNSTPSSIHTEAALLRIYSTTTTAPLVRTLSNSYRESHPTIQFETAAANHATLTTRLVNNDFPYFISNHLPSDDRLWAAPLAQDALVFITHPQNRITDITLEQIRRVYRGFNTNWLTLGGDDQKITIYSREEGAGIRAEFERLVMGQRQTSPNTQILPSTSAILQRVASETSAIAYLPFSQLLQSNAVVQALTIQGTEPAQATIGNNSYPLRITLYIIGREEPRAVYRMFIGWVQSQDGQNALQQQYTPLPR